MSNCWKSHAAAHFSFQSNGMVHFIGGESVLTCTLGDCVEETGLANSFSTALDFALNSINSKLTGHDTNIENTR